MKINIYKFFEELITKTNNQYWFSKDLLKIVLYLHEESILKNVSLSSKLPTYEFNYLQSNNSFVFTTDSCFLHIAPEDIELSNLNEDGSILVYQYGGAGLYTDIHKYLFDKEYLEYNKFSEDSYKDIDKLIDSIDINLFIPEINLTYRLSPINGLYTIFKDKEEIVTDKLTAPDKNILNLLIGAENKIQSLENSKVKHLIKEPKNEK
ncbi:MAG: hypothetical protein ACI4OT_00035 [Bacilli bacterium]